MNIADWLFSVWTDRGIVWAITFPALNMLFTFKNLGKISMVICCFLALKIIWIIGSTISISLEILIVRIIFSLIILEIPLGYKFLLLKLRLIVVFLSLVEIEPSDRTILLTTIINWSCKITHKRDWIMSWTLNCINSVYNIQPYNIIGCCIK